MRTEIEHCSHFDLKWHIKKPTCPQPCIIGMGAVPTIREFRSCIGLDKGCKYYKD